MLLGTLFLGIVQLVKFGLDIVQHLESEFVFMPVMQFTFSFFLMYFILTQVSFQFIKLKDFVKIFKLTFDDFNDFNDFNGFLFKLFDKKQTLNNVALAHIILTQFTIWFFELNQNNQGKFEKYINRTIYIQVTKDLLIPSNVSNLFLPITHQYKLMSTFILVTIWFTNNKCKIGIIKPKTYDNDESTTFISEDSVSIKGFIIGILIFFMTITILFLENEINKVKIHISIQGLIAITCLIGIGLQKKERYKYFKYHMNPIGSQIIIYITLFASYIYGIILIARINYSNIFDFNIFANGFLLILQGTFQTILVKSQENKFVKMKEIFAFLIFANISLWILEIYELSFLMTRTTEINFISFLSLFVTLNRFYYFLLFIQFWHVK